MGFFTYIKGLFGSSANGTRPKSAKDRVLQCEDCHKSFVFDEGEQRFFKAKGFTDPKRCPACRQKVRSHIRKKFRRDRKGKRHHHREHSLIDGRSPYVDER